MSKIHYRPLAMIDGQLTTNDAKPVAVDPGLEHTARQLMGSWEPAAQEESPAVAYRDLGAVLFQRVTPNGAPFANEFVLIAPATSELVDALSRRGSCHANDAGRLCLIVCRVQADGRVWANTAAWVDDLLSPAWHPSRSFAYDTPLTWIGEQAGHFLILDALHNLAQGSAPPVMIGNAHPFDLQQGRNQAALDEQVSAAESRATEELAQAQDDAAELERIERQESRVTSDTGLDAGLDSPLNDEEPE